ncbi:WXG100 family type VII secretion target [Nonomuraea sp. NPDC003560]|uniref:WXG100 family type VII secretion target n=1 Tax=Nonomuraea sp. NPDC003560 TaxID=3364341 RepID=UPI0036823E82
MSFPDPGQILRQAAEKELLAATFTKHAKALEEVFVGSLGSPQAVGAFWRGAAADRFNSQAAQLRREIELLREHCMSTAEHLRKQAELMRKEGAQLA